MMVEQFVMAYQVEQDRLRAMLPEGYESLRPVLRINAEIRKDGEAETVYLEFNTPVAAFGKRGWLNIDHWETPVDEFSYERRGSAVTLRSPFLEISYTETGAQGGCPAEQDNDGCFSRGKRSRSGPKSKSTATRRFVIVPLHGALLRGTPAASELVKRPSMSPQRRERSLMRNNLFPPKRPRQFRVNRSWVRMRSGLPGPSDGRECFWRRL